MKMTKVEKLIIVAMVTSLTLTVCSVIATIWLVGRAAEEISDKGLKGAVEQIWNGPEGATK